MATCFNCGVQLPDGAAFCGECGTAQNMQAPQQNVQQQEPPQQYVQQPQVQTQAPQPQQPQVTSGGSGNGSDSGNNRGLITGLIAAIVVLAVVIAVLGVKLMRGNEDGDAASADTGSSAPTREVSTASTEATTDATDTTDTTTEVSEEFLNSVPGYYESKEMPWVLFLNRDGCYEAVTTRTGIEETGTWEAVRADRGDGVMADMVYLNRDRDEAVTDPDAPLIWMADEGCFIVGPWEGEDAAYQHLCPAPFPQAYETGGEEIRVDGILPYTARMPAEWQDKVVAEIINEETIFPVVNFYLASEYEKGEGGLLLSLECIEDPSVVPVKYEIVGSQIWDGFSVSYLFATFPGDVAFSTQAAAKEAEGLLAYREALYDSIESPASNSSFYVPGTAGHRQEELYHQVRYDYMLSVVEEMDEDAIRKRGLSTCYFDLAGITAETENMQCAITDLNDDGTYELLMLYNYEARAIHSIGENGMPVLVYTCPYRSEMKIMADNTIRVTSSVDGSVRFYRMTADLSGLVDAGSSQTGEEASLYPFDISPAAYHGF